METYRKLNELNFKAPAEERADKLNRLLIMGGILDNLAGHLAEKKPIYETHLKYLVHNGLKGTLSEAKSKEISEELLKATQELGSHVSKFPFQSLRSLILIWHKYKIENLQHEALKSITNEELSKLEAKHGIKGLFVKVHSIK